MMIFHCYVKVHQAGYITNQRNKPPVEKYPHLTAELRQDRRGHRPILRASGTWTKNKRVGFNVDPQEKADLTSKNGDFTSKNDKNWWSCGDMMGELLIIDYRYRLDDYSHPKRDRKVLQRIFDHWTHGHLLSELLYSISRGWSDFVFFLGGFGDFEWCKIEKKTVDDYSIYTIYNLVGGWPTPI